jgi:signal transduction histidine kinase
LIVTFGSSGFRRCPDRLEPPADRQGVVRTIRRMECPVPQRPARGAGPLGTVSAVLPALAGCTEGAGGLGPWLFGSVALGLVGALAWGFATLRERRSGEAALRTARNEEQLQAGLVEGWSWQTDARHRLLHLQPPAGAGAETWSRGTEAGGLLWERFECPPPASADGLRSRLEAQTPFDDLAVQRANDGSRWRLRGRPRTDDSGRFAGYAGSARPTADDDARAADQKALQALVVLLDTPAIQAEGDGSPAGWRLTRITDAARRALEAGDGELSWADLQPRLPSPLRNAIAESRPDSASEHEGWRLRRYAGADGEAIWLVKLPQADAEAANDGASFSFTVSHDLRAPVRVVEGFTRILKEDYGRQLDRVGNDHLDRVLGAAARMNQMIDALLTLARLSQQPVARQPVNLSQLAAYIVDDLKRGAPERAAEIEIEPGLAVNGDPTLLRLVLENLLGNAWKYTARTKKANIVFGAALHEGRRAFVVRDNGAGFDMRSADRLFGLFQRLHSANDFPGTGVGLASVRRIVRRHGGEVWAEAEPGRGAAFHFTLRE